MHYPGFEMNILNIKAISESYGLFCIVADFDDCDPK